jgi:hypothetical protein
MIHIHLGGTGCARFSVGAIDALPRQPPDTGIDGFVVIVAGQQLHVEVGEYPLDLALFLFFRQPKRFDAGALFVFLALDVGNDLGAHMLEGANQETA